MNVTVTTSANLKQKVLYNIEENKDLYLDTSLQIHENPEIRNQEFFASSLLTEILENSGFKVEK